MNEETLDTDYDVIVLGTGLTECILSGLLSVDGKKVLHIDKQDHYGGAGASVSLSQLYTKFKTGDQILSQDAREAKYGKDRDWNVDLIPKFLMTNGALTDILVHTDVTKYVDFKQVDGSYVLIKGKINKVPATEMEAISSPLMGIFEKRRMKRFLEWIANYREDDLGTQQGLDLDKNTMDEVYYKFGLGNSTKEFIGHAMALWTNDDYIQQPARQTFERVLLYSQSVAKFGKSPYVYPMYGLGELPQGFARLSAIYGGTYMLDTPINKVNYNSNGEFEGVETKLGNFKAPLVIADPSYFAEKCKASGQKVVRVICVLNHPVSNTKDADSLQIIIPQSQVGRKNDIYIAVVSSTHNVCAKGHYLAICSTIVETDKPELELEPAFKLLGDIEEKFVDVVDIMEPIEDGSKDKVFLSKSNDASSHFESLTDDVKDLYKRVTGNDLILKPKESE
ncbi:hypothetical protein TPHA_0H00130 [Tetrapisispora phaffii CBS 4417]|uniref:Rab GDP dissociation inhibitor n=1 Tax=Tetrapisispora phaffii (strain ATCC 24235 / CBS 4417 / NBRC 1672 / NRRL Y-8282 / UCD 70-5) TaxID=1071381 RepID=G8BWS0_TETPH|nr:hypothetical protein TPHA_0H00130 [Tetrapisispora phaffii CBS 4417]CCE64224.1 hypothetical protein TPHA_0H00130 [Tetrapisispora phaffii CBS 4417]